MFRIITLIIIISTIEITVNYLTLIICFEHAKKLHFDASRFEKISITFQYQLKYAALVIFDGKRQFFANAYDFCGESMPTNN